MPCDNLIIAWKWLCFCFSLFSFFSWAQNLRVEYFTRVPSLAALDILYAFQYWWGRDRDCLLFNALCMQAPSHGPHHPQIGSQPSLLHLSCTPPPPPPPPTPLHWLACACIVSKVPFTVSKHSPPHPQATRVDECNNCSNRRQWPLTEIKSEQSLSHCFDPFSYHYYCLPPPGPGAL